MRKGSCRAEEEEGNGISVIVNISNCKEYVLDSDIDIFIELYEAVSSLTLRSQCATPFL